MELKQWLFEVFFTDAQYYAMGRLRGSEMTYFPLEEPPTIELVEGHLRGEHVLGAYNLLPDSTTRLIALDIDSSDIQLARNLTTELHEALSGVPHIIEFSGNKGYHVLIPLAEPMDAQKAKDYGEAIRDSINGPTRGDPHIEVFPKQGRLTDQNSWGNLLKLPLGIHPVTNAYSVLVEVGIWEEEPIRIISNATMQLRAVEQDFNIFAQPDSSHQIRMLMREYWVDGERHNLALALAGFLAKKDWTQDEVTALFLEVIAAYGGEEANLIECVESTFARLEAGETIAGYQALSEIMRPQDLTSLTVAVEGEEPSTILGKIDTIRLNRGAALLKQRQVKELVSQHLRENGKIVQTGNEVYWLDQNRRVVISMSSNSWRVMLYKTYGLSTHESFGSQVNNLLFEDFLENAEEAKIHRRSYWKEETHELFVNLGGIEIYILNGDPAQRRTILNGEENILFLNQNDGMQLDNFLSTDEIPADPWQFLTDDLSFEFGRQVQTTGNQQRELLRAWILSTFFSEAMPTRPILTFLAPTSAGKTTTARRILRILEGDNEDVLGVVTDKPDSLRASISNHRILVLDNLERTKASWLIDMLNRISTGSHIEVRKLYETNYVYKIEPDNFVICTAIEMPFSEESIYSRLLPVELKKIRNYTPELEMRKAITTNFRGIWLGLFNHLDSCITELIAHPEGEIIGTTRLADFSAFCDRIKNAVCVDGLELLNGLRSLSAVQDQALSYTSPVLQIIDAWRNEQPEQANEWQEMRTLRTRLRPVALRHRIEGPLHTVRALTQAMEALGNSLEEQLNMATRTEGGAVQYRFGTEHEIAATNGNLVDLAR